MYYCSSPLSNVCVHFFFYQDKLYVYVYLNRNSTLHLCFFVLGPTVDNETMYCVIHTVHCQLSIFIFVGPKVLRCTSVGAVL